MYDNGRKAGTSLPTVFEFGASKLESIIVNQEPWFVAADVCDALGLDNASVMLRALDDDEKLPYELLRSGQKRKVNLVNESGLYNLIFRSYRPEARAFRKWVTSEVLPAIRSKRLYGQMVTTGTLRRKCDTMDFNGTMLYNYRDVQRALGYSTSSSIANIRRRYASSLNMIGGKAYVTEQYVNLMVHRATVRTMAKDVQLALPLVSSDFGREISNI